MYWYKYLGADNLNQDDTINLMSSEYILKNRILRQIGSYSQTQSQTSDTFGYKWKKRDTYDSNNVHDHSRNWLKERYLGGEVNSDLLGSWMHDGARFLDAGCGAGFSALLLFEEYINKVNYLGVDISNAVEIALKRFNEVKIKGEFLQTELMNLPFSEPTFDIIFSEGVLHHTDSTEETFKYLANLLMPEGKFMFYVYRKKGPIREYSDDLIRNHFKTMDNNQTWEALLPLTKLGKALGEMNMKVNVPEKIPFLDIPEGPIDLQRLFYWYILKAFYRPEWTLEEMNNVNFDWYRPANCHRHTPEEIKKWCNDNNLKIVRMNVQDAGITVIAQKI